VTHVEFETPDGLAAPIAHYSLAARAGTRAYTSGIVGLDPNGELVGEGSPREQMLQIGANLRQLCAGLDTDLGSVAQCLLIVTRQKDFREVDTAYAEVFGDHKPARATIVSGLVRDEFLVELMATLELP
jgi:2-iminobutanoate/2-iminopropanoate deaminase